MKCQTVFWKSGTFYLPSNLWGFQFFHILITTYYLLFDNTQSNEYEIYLTVLCISLMANRVEYLFMSFFVQRWVAHFFLIGHLCFMSGSWSGETGSCLFALPYLVWTSTLWISWGKRHWDPVFLVELLSYEWRRGWERESKTSQPLFLEIEFLQDRYKGWNIEIW